MNKISEKEIWRYVTKSIKQKFSNKINKKSFEKPLEKKQAFLLNKEKTKNNINTKKINTFENNKLLQDNKSVIDLRNIEKLNTGLDKNTLKKIRKGLFNIDKKLDLHGKFLKEAEKLVVNFINDSYNKNFSFLLIITGKGIEGRGKIKEYISSWLTTKEFSEKILAFSNAGKKDGGDGAIYVKLRKNKS